MKPESNPTSGRRWRRRLLRVAVSGMLVLTVVTPGARLILPLVPLPATLFQKPPSELEFTDRHGQPLRTVRSGDSPFQREIAYADIPQPLIEATLAAEDRRFWRHHGVDWLASTRAAWELIRYRRVVSGGSTITQQLIKLAQPRPRTFRTKIMEAVQGLRLEQVWDKQRIVAEYLNRLDYGNFNRGCGAAAQFYFAKPLRDLSPAECALLAALPQAPTRLNPLTHLERALRCQQRVLDRMQKAGWLTDEEYRRATTEPLRLAGPQRTFEAPHFVDLLLATRVADGNTVREDAQISPASAERNHLPICTTLDLTLNRFAETALHQRLAQLKPQHVLSGAIVILENHTGGVLALVGSENYFNPDAGEVNGAWAARSAGSTFKPFTYLLAFENGATPATIVADVPTEFSTATGVFAPANYNHRCYGPMRYRLALANSLNIPAVKVLNSIGGPEPLQQLLQRCGLTTLDQPAEHYGLGLTIGNAGARLLELANAYACLARLGEFKPYRLLKDSETETRAGERVADADAAYLIADILCDNPARALAFGAESPLRFEFPVACKTGTSSNFRDNWAFGYTPEFTVGVWVGNPDGSPMQHVSGVTGAGPVLHDLFEHLHDRFGTSWFAARTNVVECRVHPLTGKRLRNAAGDENEDAIMEKFVASHLPPLEEPEDYAPEPMPPPNANLRRVVALGGEYRDWLASGDNWLANRVELTESTGQIQILFPMPGTTVFLDADLPEQGQRLILRAGGTTNPSWQSSSLRLMREGDREMALLTRGRHEIAVRDPQTGTHAETWINVLSR